MTCRDCREDKPDTEFHLKSAAAGLRHTLCKQCSRAYSARHYRENADDYKRRGLVNARAKRRLLQQKLYQYLLEHPCVDCGEADPVVLDFDHQEPLEKFLTINELRIRCYSWRKILDEIAKCEVRCANCHRRRTARQFGWDVNICHLSSVGRALD